ncbi:glycosyltransferase [Desulfovibrio sp. TomC]|uniref:glycosyltransferase n=1 Tax=Desulfovibrio sp. TomC TaxID=1562888 RepID=UPI0005730720|nr:glycosyltransferase [Desulfovibrio sp. TomC]KHK03014.1 glycosyl transferase family 2 [Desulfovibrio sp. TomC]
MDYQGPRPPDAPVAAAPPGGVNVTVVAFNRLECTRRTLAAVRALAGWPHVLTVVDNASTDGTAAFLAEALARGTVDNVVTLARNMGPAVACNLGWSLVAAEYYLRLDNDIVFTRSDWLADMAAIAAASPRIGCVSYPIYRTPGEYLPASIDGSPAMLLPSHPWSSPGGCMLFTAAVRRAMGCWCEDYGTYGPEDGDMSRRLDQAGLLRAYVPDFAWGSHIGHDDANIAAYTTRKQTRQDYHKRDHTGTFTVNCLLYGGGLRPLCMERRFVPRLGGDGRVAFVLDRDYLARWGTKMTAMKKVMGDLVNLSGQPG